MKTIKLKLIIPLFIFIIIILGFFLIIFKLDNSGNITSFFYVSQVKTELKQREKIANEINIQKEDLKNSLDKLNNQSINSSNIDTSINQINDLLFKIENLNKQLKDLQVLDKKIKQHSGFKTRKIIIIQEKIDTEILNGHNEIVNILKIKMQILILYKLYLQHDLCIKKIDYNYNQESLIVSNLKTCLDLINPINQQIQNLETNYGKTSADLQKYFDNFKKENNNYYESRLALSKKDLNRSKTLYNEYAKNHKEISNMNLSLILIKYELQLNFEYQDRLNKIEQNITNLKKDLN